MTDLDEVSKAIGRLQADAEASQRQRAEIFDQLKENGAQIAHIIATLEPLAKMAGDHDEDIKGLLAMKNKMIGYVAAIAAVGGGLGSYLTNKLHL